VDLTIPQELQQMKSMIRDFVENEIEPLAQRIEEEDAIPPLLLKKAADIGLFGMSIPEEYGGIGLGLFGRCLMVEELGRSSAGFLNLVGAHGGIGTTGIVEMGSDTLKKKYLPPMARGELIAAFALTEPEAGSDATNLRTHAVRKGDKWILNGRKHFITNGPEADLFTVIAATDRQKGIKGGFTAFLVEKGFPGFSVGTVERKMGLRGSHTSEIIFEDCEVPVENMLGQEGLGYAGALRILAKGRVTMGARCVGSCEKLIEMSTRYAQQRIQFGQPIASFQAIQWMLADMATETTAAKALTRQVAWMADQGLQVIKEAAMVKLFSSEVLGRVVDNAVQIHGGMGYMKEYPIERYYRDARITRIYEGTSEIQRLIIADRLLKELAT